MRVLKTSAPVLMAAVCLSLTACDPISTDADAVSTASADSATPTNEPTNEGAGSGSADESPAKPAGEEEDTDQTPSCDIRQLEFGTGKKGTGMVTITMVNTGGSCQLYGFPVVVAQSQYGSGKLNHTDENSIHDNDRPSPVSLQTGDRAVFEIHYTPNETGGSGITYDRVSIAMPNDDSGRSETLAVSINEPVQDDVQPMFVTPFSLI